MVRSSWFFAVSVLLLLLVAVPQPVCADDSPRARGVVLFYAENYAEAQPAFEEALSGSDTDVFDLWMTLECARRMGKLPETVARFEQKLSTKPDSANLHAQLGLAYLVQSSEKYSAVTTGMMEIGKALEIDPDCSVAHAGLGLYYYNTGKTAKARNQLQKAIDVNRTDVMSQERLGEIVLIEDDKPEKASPVFEALTKQMPYYPDDWFFLGMSEEKNKNKNAATRDYETCISLDPKGITRSVYARLRVARIYKDTKNRKKAVAVLEDLIKIRPDLKEAKEDLANIDKPDVKPDEQSSPGLFSSPKE